MESHGEPNRVHISLQTYQYIHHEFLCEDRGEIEVKGKGKMRTFFLVSETHRSISMDRRTSRGSTRQPPQVLVETPGTSARRITVSLDQAFNEGEADVEGADDADDEASRDE
uniref:Guanylate cyclase domain-containing protein n=1 Tax=Vitrella brassicaformis TaxID=1169539 RepID=A0A7S1NX55_9ALVE|mmetsp:Transcript_11996/g.28769  ORF Transcript_11996/g.28769 Transcript_11996/m.28769 type:complete len:112 (+) Transcript_11996:242-577(+)